LAEFDAHPAQNDHAYAVMLPALEQPDSPL
jgi:hypothetical protein